LIQNFHLRFRVVTDRLIPYTGRKQSRLASSHELDGNMTLALTGKQKQPVTKQESKPTRLSNNYFWFQHISVSLCTMHDGRLHNSKSQEHWCANDSRNHRAWYFFHQPTRNLIFGQALEVWMNKMSCPATFLASVVCSCICKNGWKFENVKLFSLLTNML
jgi:hypothetical protein